MRNCLIIDDNSMVDESEGIVREAKKKGINIKFLKEFNVGSTERSDLFDENKNLDLDEITRKFIEEYKNKRIDLIAIDFEFDDDKINGLDVVRQIRHKNKKAIIILYSADINSLIHSILKGYRKGQGANSATFKRIKSLFNTRISGIVKREDLEKAIITQFSLNPLKLEDLILKKLDELPEMKLKSELNEVFPVSTPGELIELIQNNPKQARSIFEEIIERALANMVNLNLEE